MKCSEFHELCAGYALDALGEEERLACEQHLAHEGPHDGCELVLARYRRAVDAVGASVPSMAVDERVWRAIELRSGTAQLKPSKVVRLGLREVLAWGIAAAALLAGLWALQSKREALTAQAGRMHVLSESERQLSQRVEQSERERRECAAALEQLTTRGAQLPLALSLLEDPETKLAPMVRTGVPDIKGIALYNAAQKRALMISSTIQPVAGKDYELWILAANEPPHPAGFISFDPSGVAVGEFDTALLRTKIPSALAVSLEPAGGGSKPTHVVLMVKL